MQKVASLRPQYLLPSQLLKFRVPWFCFTSWWKIEFNKCSTLLKIATKIKSSMSVCWADIQSRLWPAGGARWASRVEVNQQGVDPASPRSASAFASSRLRHFAASPLSLVPPSHHLTEKALTRPVCVPPSPGQGAQSVSWWSSTLQTPSARSPGWTVCTWRRSLSVSTSGAHPQARHWKGDYGVIGVMQRSEMLKQWRSHRRRLKRGAYCTYRALSGAVNLSHQAFTLRKLMDCVDNRNVLLQYSSSPSVSVLEADAVAG